MAISSRWTRQQLLVAFALYCRLPFGQFHRGNPEIIRLADAIGRSPSALAMKLSNIASLDPAITSTGRRGLQSISINDRAMWDEMQSDWERFAVESQRVMSEVEATLEQDDNVTLEEEPTIIGEDREIQATARVGQRFFRATVMSAYNRRCCITGLSLPALLVASHIVPWSHNRANRVNPRNGLLLSALHDKAFDTGLITIDDDMTVRVSPNHNKGNDLFFSEAVEAYAGKPIYLPEKFPPDKEFLAYHRDQIFQS